MSGYCEFKWHGKGLHNPALYIRGYEIHLSTIHAALNMFSNKILQRSEIKVKGN